MELRKPNSVDLGWAREIFTHLEIIHDVTYFSKIARATFRDLGTTSMWMSYFGSRSAPMGEAPSALVEATFYNFKSEMVRENVPQVWTIASPAKFIEVRAIGARNALEAASKSISEVTESQIATLERAISAVAPSGLPLFSGNQVLSELKIGSLTERLWQSATSIREYRGDCHLALLVVNEVDGLQCHLLKEKSSRLPQDRLQSFRGWNLSEYESSLKSLTETEMLDPETEELTPQGHLLRESIEAQTDLLSYHLLQHIPESSREELVKVFKNITDEMKAS